MKKKAIAGWTFLLLGVPFWLYLLVIAYARVFFGIAPNDYVKIPVSLAAGLLLTIASTFPGWYD